MITDENNAGTYVIYVDDVKFAMKDKESVYIHKAYMIFYNNNETDYFFEFGLTKKYLVI